MTVARRAIAAVTNATRAVACSGDTPATDTMDFITMASQGNATDFGLSLIHISEPTRPY